MKITEGVEALELKTSAMGRETVIYPTLIWDGDTAVLVDTGFPGQLPALRKAVEDAGVDFDSLEKVILTHQDIDHVGSLPDLVKAREGKIEVICHAEEKPYIDGTKPFIKLSSVNFAQMAKSAPAPMREQLEQLIAHPPVAPVDKVLTDGEELPILGGIVVIHTPGHTPGHIGLYLRESKTLIAGDSLVMEGGKLCGPRPSAAADIALAVKSLEKYAEYDIKTVVCYHGGVFSGDANKAIAELAKG